MKMAFVFRCSGKVWLLACDLLLTVTDLQVLLGWTRASDNSRDELDLYLWETWTEQ